MSTNNKLGFTVSGAGTSALNVGSLIADDRSTIKTTAISAMTTGEANQASLVEHGKQLAELHDEMILAEREMALKAQTEIQKSLNRLERRFATTQPY